MQFVDVQAGPIDRAFGIASVTLHTASTETAATIPGLPADEATRYATGSPSSGSHTVPDSEPPTEAAEPRAVEQQGDRTHPLTGLVQGVLWAGVAMAAVLGQLFTGGNGEDGLPLWLDVLMRVGRRPRAGRQVRVPHLVVHAVPHRWHRARITSGILQKSSRRIPYERIQSVDIAEPFLARIIGLAELRIEMAGGNDSRTTLRFLPLDDARRLRRLLLGRAHGQSAEDLEVETAEPELELIAHVSPGRVVLGTVLSLDFLAAVLGTIASSWRRSGSTRSSPSSAVSSRAHLAGSDRRQARPDAVGLHADPHRHRAPHRARAALPLVAEHPVRAGARRRGGGAVRLAPARLATTGGRRRRVRLTGNSDSSDINSTLLPIADPALAAAVLDELVPGAQSAPEERVPVPRRSWPFAPIGWRYRWVAADDVAFVARSGWLERTTDVVPHARTQSVELRQGPWQRRLNVATVEIHTPKGPVDADGPHLDAADAHRVAFTQLALARRARAPRTGESAAARGVLGTSGERCRQLT